MGRLRPGGGWNRYRMLFESVGEGFAVVEMIFDRKSKTIDYAAVEIKRAYECHSGLRRGSGNR